MTNYFAKNLLYLRTKRKLSQNRLGQLIGVNASTIKRWEEESMSPGIDKVDTISNIFNVPVSTIIDEDLSLYTIEPVSEDVFKATALEWVKTNDMTSEEKQRFLRELSRLIDEEDNN